MRGRQEQVGTDINKPVITYTSGVCAGSRECTASFYTCGKVPRDLDDATTMRAEICDWLIGGVRLLTLRFMLGLGCWLESVTDEWTALLAETCY